MISGVVIWHSAEDCKALIWCEDSGALAIALGPASWRDPSGRVSVGDCVGLSAVHHGRERIATDVHLIASQVAPDLPEAIRPDLPSAPRRMLAVVGGEARKARGRAERGHGAAPAGVPARPPLRSGIPLLHLCASRD